MHQMQIDTVTYKAFGKFIAVDEKWKSNSRCINNSYTNDPNDATKMIAINKTLPTFPATLLKVIPITIKSR